MTVIHEPLVETLTADRVRGAALRFFATKGFAATGIREIADAAGISSAALYHYMGTKEDLLAALAKNANERILTAARSVLAHASAPEEQLVALVRLHVLAHVRFRQEALLVDNELRSLTEDHRAMVIDIRDAYEKLWHSCLLEGRRLKLFGVDDVRTTRLALLEMCTGVAHWFTPERGLSDVKLSRQFADLALATVRASRNGQPIALRDVAGPTDAILVRILDITPLTAGNQK